MDALLERVRAANTVTEDEFAGLADFDALALARRRAGVASGCSRSRRSARSSPRSS